MPLIHNIESLLSFQVTNLIQDDGEAQLALFLSKTLTNAIMMYRQGGPSGAGPIGPPSHNKPGPIGKSRVSINHFSVSKLTLHNAALVF